MKSRFRWLRHLILVVGLLAVGSIQAHGEDTTDDRIDHNASAIQDFLTKPIPTARGHVEFFNDRSPEDSSHWQLNIKDEKLEAAAERGAEFREVYLGWLKEGLDDQSFEYLTRYEWAVYDRILQLLSLKRKSRQDRMLTELEAEQQALRIVATRFGLPQDLTLPQLVASRMERNYEQAYYSYQREFFKALQQETLGDIPDRLTIREIKQKLLRELEVAREANFLNAWRFSERLKSLPGATITHSNGENSELKPLGTPVSLLVSDNSLFEVMDRISFREGLINQLDRLTGYFSLKKRNVDHDVAKDFYLPTQFSPKWTRGRAATIEFEGRTIRITEADFSELMNQLRHPDTNNLFSKKQWEKRYLVEASKRDALIADMIRILMLPDETVEALLSRLGDQKAISSSMPIDVKHSLTEEIRGAQDPLVPHFFNDVRWSGYSVHPDFWRLKSASATSISAPHIYTSLLPDYEPPVREKHETKYIKKKNTHEKRMNRHRTSSRLVRRGWMWVPFALWAGGIAGGIWGTVEGIGLAKDYFGPIDPGFNLPEPPVNLPRFSSPENWYKTRGDDDHYVVPKKAGADGLEKGEPVFHVVWADEPVPEYFNIADTGNLPEEVLLDRYSGSEPDVVTPLEVMEFGEEGGDVDIVITGSLRVTPEDNRYGILSLPGYRLQSIEVRNAYGDVWDHWSYTVYELPQSGLTYIEPDIFYLEGRQFITYDVTYVKDDRPVNSHPSFENMNPQVLEGLVDMFGGLGATQLQGVLSEDLQSGSVSVQDVNAAFSTTGYYTYRRVQSAIDRLGRWGQSLFTSENEINPFQEYERYLLDGAFYYQCSASNNVMIQFFNMYAEGANAPFEAQSIHGFRYDGSGTVGAGQGHRHTLVTVPDQPRTWMELDATPLNKDPVDQKPKSTEKAPPLDPGKDEEMRIFEGILPRRPELEQDATQPVEDGETDAVVRDIEDEEADEEIPVYDPRNDIAILLDEKIKTMSAFIEAEATGGASEFFKNTPVLVAVPGVNVTAYASVLKELMERKISAELTLVRLHALNSGFSKARSLGLPSGNQSYEQKLREFVAGEFQRTNSYEPLFREVFAAFLNKWSVMLNTVETSINNTGDSNMGFLLAPEWRGSVQGFQYFMQNLDYKNLIDDEPPPSLLKSAEDEEAAEGLSECEQLVS